MTDSQDRNVLHHAVLKEHDGLVKQLVLLDADHSKLRSQKDTKGKTPLACDGKGQFKDIFTTVWDAAREGALDKLKVMIRPGTNDQEPKNSEAAAAAAEHPGKHQVDDGSPWLGNTPLHVAVKAKQIKAVKLLVWDLNANSKAKNANNLTPVDYCKKYIKDEATRFTVMGLLTKMHKDTTVQKNLHIKKEKEAIRQQEQAEMKKLRDDLKAALQKRGLDIAAMFKKFDANGDGKFDQVEFEAAFTVLEIDFKVVALRKLVALSDKNMDGKVDAQEFTDMLYGDIIGKNEESETGASAKGNE